MDSFEYNKLIGAFLGTLFVVFSVGIVSDAIFATPHPEKEGFAIEVAEVEGGGGGGPVADAVEPIAVRLASADVAAGQALEKRCAACHTIDKGGANKVGPNVWDIVNRPVASHEGFSYSSAMREFSQGGSVVWDYEHLDQFIASPKGLVRGTAMGFAGLKNPKDRADLIAFLRTLSDNPAPLPAVEAPQAENASAPAEGAAQAEPAAEGAAPAAPAEAAPAAPAEAPAAPAEGAAPAAPEAAPAAPAEAAPAAPAEAAPAAPAEAQPAAPAEGAAPAAPEPAPAAPAEGTAPAPAQ